MKKKNIVIIIVVLLIVSLLGIGIFAAKKAIDKADKDKKQREKEEKEIIDNFDKFKEAIEGFSLEWSTYEEIIKSDINENTIYQYDGWILSIDTYTQALDEVEKASDIYKKRCINNYYAKKSVEDKCKAFMDAYERAVNSYVVDIEDFNEKIKTINAKAKQELKEYELKYEKVDINKDKEYSVIEVEDNSSDTETNDNK